MLRDGPHRPLLQMDTKPLLHAALFPLLLLLAACTGTPYQPLDPEKGSVGYSSALLKNHYAQVRFSGNPNSDRERVRDFAFLRAAELTKAAGFTHFRIEHEQLTRGGTFATSTTIISTPVATDPRYRQYRSHELLYGEGDRRIMEDVSIKAAPHYTLVIRMGNLDTLPDDTWNIAAEEEIQRTRKKYGLKG